MHWREDINCSPATIRRRSAPWTDTKKTATAEESVITPTDSVMKGDRPQCTERLNSKAGHRYRLRKTTLAQVKRWQPEEGEPLGEILKQERLAWQAELPVQLSLRISSKFDEEQRDLLHISSLSPCIDRSHRRNTIDIADFAQQNERETVAVDQAKAVPFLNIQDPFNTPDEFKTRKSCFLEGSMNERSRATASSWQETSHAIPQYGSASSSILAQEESGFSTPRPSVSSRTSFSSSIDVSEFKPLPPTPTIFKNTIKRLGHKMRTAERPQQQPALRDLTKPPATTTRTGLRKSLSTWKFFESTASEADSEQSMYVQEASKMTIKGSQSSRTLKLLGRHKQQSDSCEREPVLDERKRRAEIAYKEQFSTTHKKQKHSQSYFPPPRSANHQTQSATVRRREPSCPQANNVPSVDRIGADESCPETSVSGLTSFPAGTLLEVKHHRTSSQESTRTTASNRDRLKRVSRSELEKENMQLRTLLREHDNHSRTLRPTSRSVENERLSSSFDVGTKSQCIVSTPIVYQHFEHAEAENIPPVPTLPFQHNPTGLLVSAICKFPQIDSSTVKRSTATIPASRDLSLPRPLSMVLEDLEDRQASNTEIAVDQAIVKCNDGDNQPSGLLQVRPHGQSHQPDELWQWPEDVF